MLKAEGALLSARDATLEIAGGFGLPLDLDESFNRLLQMFVRTLQTGDGK